jgi:hypothetical protein
MRADLEVVKFSDPRADRVPGVLRKVFNAAWSSRAAGFIARIAVVLLVTARRMAVERGKDGKTTERVGANGWVKKSGTRREGNR